MKIKFKETEIRDDKYLKKILYYGAQDRKFLFRYKKDFVRVACPACGQKIGRLLFKKQGFHFLICGFCQTVYVSPRPTAAILKKFYQQSKVYWFWNKYIFPQSEKIRRQKIFKPRVDLVLDYCKKFKVSKNRLIEVGAGFGTFCQEIKSRNIFKNVAAIEPVPSLAQTCRQKKIEVIEKPVEEVKLGKDKANVIVCFETIEHLYEPKQFILSCKKLLKQGGLLFLSCPNMYGFDTLVLGKISKTVGGGHINLFNPNSIKILLASCQLKLLEIKTPGKLDAELVRKSALAGKFDLKQHPFLKYILLDKWDKLADKFQNFLADNLLSSHMWVVARKK